MARASLDPDVEAAAWMRRISTFERILESPPVLPSIHRVHKLRVPAEQRKVNPEAYTPQILFLGFKNRRNPVEDLGVDKYKVEWARQFLAWKADSDSEEGSAEVTSSSSGVQCEGLGEQWKRFVLGLQIDVNHAHSMYEIQPELAPDVVQKVLAMDALFLLLLILRIRKRGLLPAKYFGRDALAQPHEFGYGYPWAKLYADMFLLENQIPLYILARVWTTFPGRRNSFNLPISDLLYYRYVYLFPEVRLGASKAQVEEVISNMRHENCDHLLHCLLQLVCYNPRSSGKKHFGGAISIPSVSAMRKAGMHCATAGITFLHQIRFDQARSCLMLPRIKVLKRAEVYLRNLLALESSLDYPGMVTVFVEYLSLMDDLVDTEEDVRLLERYGVMSHMLGRDSEVALIWNTLQLNVGIAQSTQWADMLREVNERHNSRTHRLFTEFKSLYFSRPWVTLSLVAAILLLVMTALQTVYSVLSYYLNV